MMLIERMFLVWERDGAVEVMMGRDGVSVEV